VDKVSKSRFAVGKKGSLLTKLVIVGALLVTILYTVYLWVGVGEIGTYELLSNMTETIGNLLFTEYGIVVIMLGFVLFAAMLGSVYIAQEDDE
jgi:NADH:ubiquinone oxidoreductase subunit 6 (subunit J)